MRAFFEALTAFLKALALVLPELIPLIRLKVRRALLTEAEAQYGQYRKRFMEALASGDPNRVAAEFALMDEQLLSRGIGIEALAAEHRSDLPGGSGQAASGNDSKETGRSRGDAGQGNVDSVSGVSGSDEQASVSSNREVRSVPLPELMEELERRLQPK